MAKIASQYPITTKYGWVKGYPLHTDKYDPAVPLIQRSKYPGKGYGFHTGVDRAMPIGTLIIVNGTIIGRSGNTGASTGAHLHIGRFILGISTDPKDKGFSFGATYKMYVLATGYSSANGNYIRLRSATYGHVYLYCHLSKITCKVGQRL